MSISTKKYIENVIIQNNGDMELYKKTLNNTSIKDIFSSYISLDKAKSITAQRLKSFMKKYKNNLNSYLPVCRCCGLYELEISFHHGYSEKQAARAVIVNQYNYQLRQILEDKIKKDNIVFEYKEKKDHSGHEHLTAQKKRNLKKRKYY